jgi:RNA polymerase sigma-70 factor, ECF subfamily
MLRFLRQGSPAADDELFRRMKSGDAGALKTLFERHYPALCRFSESIVKNAESAEEAVSDVFAALWLRRSVIEIRSGVKPYLYAAVRNQSLNALRSSGIHMVSIDGDESVLPDSGFEADAPLAYEELEYTLEAIIDRMPARRRMIFRMSRIDGLSYQEIADILSLSIHTVQNQMVEAVKFLSRFSHRQW